MAFSLFKKSVKADLVLYNGHIITQDAELPEASAVACADGKIISVGDFDIVEPMIGADTEVVDLQGKYVLPGLIDLSSHPVMPIFKDKYIDLRNFADFNSIVDEVRCWTASHLDFEIIFGYGYSENLLGDNTEESIKEAMRLLDEVCDDKPIVLLCESTVSCLLNTAASEIVKETAEEEMVSYITVPYILNLFVPFNFEIIEKNIEAQINENISRGFTSVLSLDAPDYFEGLYRDSLISLHNEGRLCQRFFGSYLMNRPLLPKALIHRLMTRKTMCNEMDGLINAKMLDIGLDNLRCPVEFSQESLNTIMENVADKGFDIYIKAASLSDLKLAYWGAEHVRSKGYKNIIAIESSYDIESISNELIYYETVMRINPHRELEILPVEAVIEKLTVEAAELLGASNFLGSIQKEKSADMAVFDANPLDMGSEKFLHYTACMTIFSGKII